MKIEPTNEQRNYVKGILDKGMGKRGEFDGDYFKRLFGHIAQVIVADEFDKPRPKDLTKPDAGWDIEIGDKKYDVKCMINNFDMKPSFFHNVPASQINYEGDGYIFVAYNNMKGIYDIRGFISKEKFKEKSTFRKKGERKGDFVFSYDEYELEDKKLKRIKHLLHSDS